MYAQRRIFAIKQTKLGLFLQSTKIIIHEISRIRGCDEKRAIYSISVAIAGGTGCREGGINLNKKPPERHPAPPRHPAMSGSTLHSDT